MCATDFEFRHRFWIFGAIYGIAFYCYRFDHVNSAVALLHWLAPRLDVNSPAALPALRLIFSIGALFFVAFAIIRTWATAYLQTDVVHDSEIRTEALVADGPYRFTRNPLYFANLLMAIGVGMMASRLGWIIAVGGTLLFQYRLILREESELLRTQGESYRAFVSAVPRFFPALHPKVPSSGARPRWGQAFAGETFFWIFTLASICFAITLDMKIAAIFWGISMVGYAVMQFLRRRSRKHIAA